MHFGVSAFECGHFSCQYQSSSEESKGSRKFWLETSWEAHCNPHGGRSSLFRNSKGIRGGVTERLQRTGGFGSPEALKTHHQQSLPQLKTELQPDLHALESCPFRNPAPWRPDHPFLGGSHALFNRPSDGFGERLQPSGFKYPAASPCCTCHSL